MYGGAEGVGSTAGASTVGAGGVWQKTGTTIEPCGMVVQLRGSYLAMSSYLKADMGASRQLKEAVGGDALHDAARISHVLGVASWVLPLLHG